MGKKHSFPHAEGMGSKDYSDLSGVSRAFFSLSLAAGSLVGKKHVDPDTFLKRIGLQHLELWKPWEATSVSINQLPIMNHFLMKRKRWLMRKGALLDPSALYPFDPVEAHQDSLKKQQGRARPAYSLNSRRSWKIVKFVAGRVRI